METKWRWTLIAAVAPIAWGSTYYVTRQFLPADFPLWGGVLRALPAGILLLLLIKRQLPHGSWWWRAAVIGALNVGAFFVLVYLAAQLLPTSIAATIMATSPVVMMLFAWLLVSEKLRALALVGGALGIAGVAIMLAGGAGSFSPWGVVASISAMTMSSLGYILAKRWSTDLDVLSLTSWQLIAGGAMLVPVALVWEGAPPALDGVALAGFAYVGIVATALAFVAWFSALRRLDAATVGLVGLVNPVTGVLLGTLVAGEALGAQQIAGLVLVFAGILLGQPAAARVVGRLVLRGVAPFRGGAGRDRLAACPSPRRSRLSPRRSASG
ncbi:EamA family transporter [Agromyces protaetiae]|uniref:EamA family transporter n=1 Tax=Agromyces protaetiae TaxID=2509455 RepID=A0A4P6FES7_9MICO|nr:EamA family transporter [Agromyces protaetiae]QAY73533.1 EamA family transporter [Agromyces protaetiae]